jgi:hypothetical protein
VPTGRKYQPASPATLCNPRWEAKGLARLVAAECFTVEEIRALIRISPDEARELRKFGKIVAARTIAYRGAVLRFFNLLAARGRR